MAVWKPPRSLRPHLWLIPLVIGYTGLLTSWTLQLPGNTSTPYHLLQADAFLAGRIDVEPAEFHYDLAYRDGKWLMYWGYAPAAVLVPFRWAFGTALTDRSVAIAIGLLTMVVWYLIARDLPSLGFPPLRHWEVLVLTFYCSFGQLTFNLSKSPIASYTNHLFAFFFLSLSVLCLLRPTRGRVIAATATFCLACLTRLSLFIVAPLFAVTLLGWMNGNWRAWKNRKTAQVAITVGAMLGFSVCLQLYLNHARFGSALDFGVPRFIPGENPDDPVYSPRYVARNLWIYLVSPVQYSLTRPFVLGAPSGNAIWSYQFGVLIPLLACAWTARMGRARLQVSDGGERGRTRRLILGLAAMWVVYFVYLLLHRFTGVITFGGRYLLDLQPFLLLVILISYACVKNQPALRAFSVICMVLSGVVQIVSPAMLR